MSQAKNHLSMGTSITLTRRSSQQNASSTFPRMWCQLSVFWRVLPVQVSNRNSHNSFPSDCLMSRSDLSDHLRLKMLWQHKIQSLFFFFYFIVWVSNSITAQVFQTMSQSNADLSLRNYQSHTHTFQRFTAVERAQATLECCKSLCLCRLLGRSSTVWSPRTPKHF